MPAAYDLAECSVPSTEVAFVAQSFAAPAPAVFVTPVPPIAQAFELYSVLSTIPVVCDAHCCASVLLAAALVSLVEALVALVAAAVALFAALVSLVAAFVSEVAKQN